MSKKLFIGNLPFSATDQSLTDIFAQLGQVSSAKVITDKFSGRSKGYGFVEMTNDDEATNAIERFNGADYEGRAITVAEARPQEPRAPREGGRPPFGGGGAGRGRFGGGGRDGGGGRGGERGGRPRGGQRF